MKVTVPQVEDKQLIYSLYNTATDRDSGSIDYFFSEFYKEEDYLIYKKNDVVMCCLKAHDETLYLKGYHVSVKVIDEVIVSRNCSRGEKDEFLDYCIQKFEKDKLFTIVTQAMIQNRGFEDVFQHKRYKLYRKDLFNVDGYSISNQFELHDLQKAYQKFVAHFDSYLHKDLNYFEEKLKRLDYDNYEIYVTRNRKYEIVGYIVYNYIGGELEVVKVVYEDTLALLTLLNQAMGMNNHIYVHVSKSENLEKVFGSIKYELIKDVFIRVNDLELFRRLYPIQASSLAEFLSENHRPLYLGFY